MTIDRLQMTFTLVGYTWTIRRDLQRFELEIDRPLKAGVFVIERNEVRLILGIEADGRSRLDFDKLRDQILDEAYRINGSRAEDLALSR